MSSSNSTVAIPKHRASAAERGWGVSWPEIPYFAPLPAQPAARRSYWSRGRHHATRFSCITVPELTAAAGGTS